MLRFVASRLFYLLLVMLAVSMFVFALSRVRGDPRYLYLDEYATLEQYEAWGRQMGLDRPLVVQYGVWLSNTARGDLGMSLLYRQPALDVVLGRVPATLQLAAGGFVFMLLLSVPFGVISAVKRGSALDVAGRTIAAFGQALPGFWIGIMLILLFAVALGWLPTGRRGGIDHYILPAISLGSTPAAGMLRLVRSSMLEVLDSEFIKLARAKGVPSRMVIWKHAFRNALIAPLTFASLILAGFVTGAIVNETVFAWPGLGRLSVEAVFQNDYPVMVTVVMLFSGIYVFVNLLVDIAYAYLDPRIRYR